MSFSSALRLTDLDDYIRPAVECILPDARAVPNPHEGLDRGAADAGSVSLSMPHENSPDGSATAQVGQKRVEVDSSGDAFEIVPGGSSGDAAPGLAGDDPSLSLAHVSASRPSRGLARGGASDAAAAERRALKKVKVDLTDCLACSGCVTSAEAVLVEAQSTAELRRELARHGDAALGAGAEPAIVFSVAPEAAASLAARFEVPLASAYAALSAFLKTHLGATHVVDLALAARIEAVEAGREFVARYREGPRAAARLPLLCSTCPGWVCYAEKRHGEDVIPYMSQVRSPQQVLGALIKRAGGLGPATDARHVYHAAIMMCFDKKLEASRAEFATDAGRDVDIAVTTSEIVDLMEEAQFDFAAAAAPPADPSASSGLGLDGTLSGIPPGGGLPATGPRTILEAVLRTACREILGKELPPGPIELKRGRNPDFQEITVRADTGASEPGAAPAPSLTFALAQGFRNIQTVVRAIKRGKAKYDYVEVLACPGGCANGGGQAKPKAPADDDPAGLAGSGDARALLARVRETLASRSADPSPSNDDVLRLYESALADPTGRGDIISATFTAPKINPAAGSSTAPNPMALQW